MRKIFVDTIIDLAKQDERIVLLTADLGFMVLEPFIEKFPQRYFNVGVAEQNMVGVATGLAEAGFIPFVYSIVTFATLRPFEIIRNGPIKHHLPVRIVGMGGGYEYSHAGQTHHGLEDIAVMRSQPGITIVSPADDAQTETALRTTYHLPGPIYYRFSKNDNTQLKNLHGQFAFDKVQIVRNGSKALWITTGAIAVEVEKAADLLAVQGIETTIAVVASFNPSPALELIKILSQFRNVMTVEAHYISGGLGSYISELIAENNLHCRLIRHGISPAGTSPHSGNMKFYNSLFGLDAEALAKLAFAEFDKAVS
jgi:transketolase